MRFSITQARFNKVDVLPWSSDALFCLLLKSVQNVHHTGKTHGVNGPVGIAVEIVDQFQNPFSAFAAIGSSPSCTWFNAYPKRFCTLAGNRFRSLRLEPIKMQGFGLDRLLTQPIIEMPL
jgi:hypothetical protein